MAKKKRSTRRTAPHGTSSDRITEQQHDEAVRTLRAEYYSAVRSMAHDLGDRVKNGDIQSQDDWESALHQEVDGSYWAERFKRTVPGKSRIVHSFPSDRNYPVESRRH